MCLMPGDSAFENTLLLDKLFRLCATPLTYPRIQMIILMSCP